MIRLDVDNYCSTCPDFEPDVEKYILGYDHDLKVVNTIIRCEHRDRCRNTAKYLREELEVTEHD